MTTNSKLKSAEALVATLEQNARNTDSAGVPIEHVTALRDAGLLAGADAVGLMEAGRTLAHGCGATAWLATSFAEAAGVVAKMDKAAAKDVGDALVTPAKLCKRGRIEGARDKRLISGVWPAVGGLQHAQWLLLYGLEGDNGRYCALIPAAEVASEDFIYFGGLRGLRWRSVTLDNVEIPAHRIIAESALDADVVLLGALLGTAEGAYADYVRGTKARISGVGGKAVAEFTQVQTRLAESSADLKGITALYQDVLVKTAAGQGDSAECARDRAYIARRSVEAVNRLLAQMGAMGLAETNPVQRRFRDLRTFAAAPGLTWNTVMAAFGRAELGITKTSD
ncbi:MAG: acyl-CoA dehydrogenase family protein [Hyphomonadaceae bacterium]